MSTPLFSICLMGRNDNYGHDFKRRFVQSMNFLAWSAERAGILDQLEVVFTDWNSTTPLAEDIRLSELASSVVRFISVPPELAANRNYGKTPFHTGLSLNVAFRRARGKYIGMMPGDILFTQYSLRSLMAVLHKDWPLPFDPEETLLGLPRKFLPSYVDDARYFDSCEDTERLLSGGDWYLNEDKYSRALNGGYGMWIMPATYLYQVRGTLESIGGWGYSDTDIAMRLADKLQIVNLGGYGVFCYDFEISIQEYRAKNKNIRFLFEHFSLESGANPSDWGMVELELPERKAKTGAYTPPSSPAKALVTHETLLWNSRALQVNFCRRFSKLAMASAELVEQKKCRKIAFLGIGDISVPTAVSLIDPLIEMLIIENSPDNVLRFENLDKALSESRHLGKLHYAPELPTAKMLENLELLVVQSQDFVQLAAQYLTHDGIVVAEIPLDIPGKHQQNIDNIYFYTNPKESFLDGKSSWQELPGNFLLRKSISRQFVRLWNIFARVPLWRWPGTIKTLWRILR
jgi:hypothetical protein